MPPFKPTPTNTPDPRVQAVITIRMFPELHQRLKTAGHKAEISMNKLVVDMLEHCLKAMEENNNV